MDETDPAMTELCEGWVLSRTPGTGCLQYRKMKLVLKTRRQVSRRATRRLKEELHESHAAWRKCMDKESQERATRRDVFCNNVL